MFNNYSELIMKKHHISHDQYQASIYTVAFIIIFICTTIKGELKPGLEHIFLYNGTVSEIKQNQELQESQTMYTRNVKLVVVVLFTLMGLLGSSCASAITKRFGALRMSVTSTTRKAFTLFISLAAPGFHNKCTPEHIIGMIIFVSALFVKSFQTRKKQQTCEERTKSSLHVHKA